MPLQPKTPFKWLDSEETADLFGVHKWVILSFRSCHGSTLLAACLQHPRESIGTSTSPHSSRLPARGKTRVIDPAHLELTRCLPCLPPPQSLTHSSSRVQQIEYRRITTLLDRLVRVQFIANVASDTATVQRIEKVISPYKIAKSGFNVDGSKMSQSKASDKPKIDALGRTYTKGSRKDGRAQVWMAFTPGLKDKLYDPELENRFRAKEAEMESLRATEAAKKQLSIDAGAKALNKAWRAKSEEELIAARAKRTKHLPGTTTNPIRLNPLPKPQPLVPTTPHILPIEDHLNAAREPDSVYQSMLWNEILEARNDSSLDEAAKRAKEDELVVRYNNTYPWASLAYEQEAVREKVAKLNQRAEEILALQRAERVEAQQRLAQQIAIPIPTLESLESPTSSEDNVISADDLSQALDAGVSSSAATSSTPSATTSTSSAQSPMSSSSSSSTAPSSSGSISDRGYLANPADFHAITTPPSTANSNMSHSGVPKDGTIHIPVPRQPPANSDPILGQILVNNVPLHRYFSNPRDRETVMRPFRVAGLVGAFNVFALVQDGGTTGQSGALSLAIARAIAIHSPLAKNALTYG